MKTKNKIVAFLEIAIVLCSLLLVALPAIAAEQTTQKVIANTITTASEDDFVLGIYGNANEDDTIDMRDLTYVKLIFFGKKPETELADAKYDGKINPLDFIQIKLIIVGKEKELTVIDTAKRIVTVKKPVKRVVVTFNHHLETLRSIKVPKDIIVGIGTMDETTFTEFFPEFSEVQNVGGGWDIPNIEAILNLHPDAVILHGKPSLDAISDELESAGITVLRFWCHERSFYPEEVKKLGYIFGKQAKAEELLDFREKILNSIKERVGKIPEENKPKVYFEANIYRPYMIYNEYAYIEMAGGKDIFADIPWVEEVVSIDPEAVIERDPDIIIKVSSGGGYNMDTENTAKLEKVRDDILSRPELENVKAVKSGRVYIAATHIYSAFPGSGCRRFILIAYQAKWFHPNLFEDIDPKAIHQEYITRFQGLDIDFDERGVFVYPPLES